MNFGIIVFPGTWSDTDCHHAVTSVLGQRAEFVWHRDLPAHESDLHAKEHLALLIFLGVTLLVDSPLVATG